MSKAWRTVALTLFVFTVLAGAFFGDHLLASPDDPGETMRVYTELLDVAHESYGEEVTYKDLVFASIQGMLRNLDPHTSFLPPRAYTSMRERQQSTFYGLGILVSVRNGQLTVMTPIEGTPASRLGIRPGDVISTIEGEPTDTMSLDDAVTKLKGPKGTQVNIEIVRRGLEEPLQLSVTRAEIPQTTVRHAFMLDDKTGYIWLTDFNRSSSEEVADAVGALKAQGMEQLLFDLRNNGGGLLDQAIDVADQFVPGKGRIVETKGRTPDSFQTFGTSDNYPDLDLPVIALVNRGTASAAEIVSGAIQDHDVGLIVGTPTWGKGLVQTVYNLPYGAGLALTTARYYTPSGRLIQRDYSSYYDYVTVGGLGDAEILQPRGDEPVFHTDLGREVFGGGGITPDVLVEGEEILPFGQLLLARNAFLNYAVDYLRENEVENESWRPKESMLEDFRTWLAAEDLATAEAIEEGFAEESNRRYMLRMIGSEVLSSRFGQEAQQKLIAEGDPQVQRAMAMFDNAQSLLARREAFEAGIELSPNPELDSLQ